MTAKTCIPALAALLSLPALAQGTTVQQQPGTTTTVQTAPGSTTVQTQPPPPPPQPAPGTQVVVNPPAESAPPPPATTTRVYGAYDTPVVVEERHRPPMAIIATDALYGGLAGVLVGGGIALLDDGNHWQRDLMVGAGAGILAGVGVGIAQAVIDANDSPRPRAVADQIRPEGSTAPGGTALAFRTRW